MRFLKVTLVLALMTLMSLPVLAQAGDRGSGSVGMGRRGATWQTDINLAKEELREFEAELQRMTEREWMQTAVAWIAYGYSGDNKLTVEDSHRIAKVDPGKKAEVEDLTMDPPTWGIAWGRKPPRTLKLVLTDDRATTVNCSLSPKKKLEAGYMGIFVRGGDILCVPREPFPESAEDEPAA